MDTYYKYTKFFGSDYFKRPTIRISNPMFLNDPFESEAGNNLIHVIEDRFNRIQKGINKSRIEIKEILNYALRANGIFSVSETPRNALMWAHYADEHSGLCIGFDDEIFNKNKLKNEHWNSINTLLPQKVNYDNYRFDKQTIINSQEDTNKAIITHLLTKSDDWIYEKEHRWIVPFYFSSSFKLDLNHRDQTPSFNENITAEKLISELLELNMIDRISKNEFKFNEKTTDTIIACVAAFKCIIFLYEVDPRHIKSIHIGLRVSNKNVVDLYSTINDESLNLSHIKLYKLKLSDSRFELLPTLVDDQYISELIS